MLKRAGWASPFLGVVAGRDGRQAPVVCETFPRRPGKAYGADTVDILTPKREVSGRSLYIYPSSDWNEWARSFCLDKVSVSCPSSLQSRQKRHWVRIRGPQAREALSAAFEGMQVVWGRVSGTFLHNSRLARMIYFPIHG